MAEDKTDEKEQQATSEEGGEEGEGKKSKKKLFIIIGGVVFLLLIGGGVFFFMSGGDDPASEQSSEKAEGGENEESDEEKGKEKGKEKGDADAESDKAEESEESSKDDSKDEDLSPEALAAKKYGQTYELKPFNLNLGNPLENRYIRIVIALEFKGGEAQRGEILAKRPKIRDIIVNLTTKKTMEFLLGPDGKDHLRHEMFISINQVMEKKIEAVYITDMLIE